MTAGKAVAAALVALFGALATAASDGHVTLAEAFLSAATTVGAFGGTYYAPYKAKG